MERTNNAFRGKVIEKYGTIGNFAKAMRWSYRKASYITNGRQQMTAKEREDCAETLDVDNEIEFLRIFYPSLSIKWTRTA